jgi:iron complex transport system substrate-binding protein
MARRLVLLAVTALVATACGERAEPLGILAQNYPVKVRGAGDRIAVLDHAPKRIVTLDSGEAETLLALHVGTALVGAPAGTPGTSALTVVRPSGLVDVDSVVRLKPDLVVATSRTDPLDLDTVEHATRAPVYVAPDSSFRDVEDGTLDLGFLVGRPVDARRLVARIRADVDRVEARLAGAAPVTVFIDTGLFITAATRSLLGDLVHLAHGRSVAGPHPGDDPVSPRRIAELDPDIYLATSDSGVTLRGLRRDRAARKIPAVRAGHFAVVASELVNEPGPRVGEGLASVAKALHPDAFR